MLDGRGGGPRAVHGYATLAHRPADPERFNHTAIVSWNNVTAGYELFQGESPEILQGGYAFVAASVSARRRATTVSQSYQPGPGCLGPRTPRLAQHSHETSASYDIFTQVARAVGPNRARDGVDPLAGLGVRKAIGIGASSWSAGRLATYVNAVHPLEHGLRRLPPADLLRARDAAGSRPRHG